MLYHIYNHFALGPMAHELGDYKCDITFVACRCYILVNYNSVTINGRFITQFSGCNSVCIEIQNDFILPNDIHVYGCNPNIHNSAAIKLLWCNE